MTNPTDITFHVDAELINDLVADCLEAAADRTQAASTPLPPSRLAIASWLVVIAACTALGWYAAFDGDLFAAAGWAVAALAYGALGLTRRTS